MKYLLMFILSFINAAHAHLEDCDRTVMVENSHVYEKMIKRLSAAVFFSKGYNLTIPTLGEIPDYSIKILEVGLFSTNSPQEENIICEIELADLNLNIPFRGSVSQIIKSRFSDNKKMKILKKSCNKAIKKAFNDLPYCLDEVNFPYFAISVK